MDRLQPTEQLNVGDQLVSNNGRVSLVMQGDGNLVLYRADDGRALWASNTAGRPVAYAVMQGNDGNFVAYDANQHPYWASHTNGHPGAWVVLQDDGNLVVYDVNGLPLWASNTVQYFGPTFVPAFKPSTNAPLFGNGPWPAGTSLRIGIVNLDSTSWGLCGGMSFLTRDIFESGTPQLRGRKASEIPLALAEHLLSRLIDSFDSPWVLERWLSLMRTVDHDTVVGGAGVFRQTLAEIPAIIADVDNGILSPIGLVLVYSWGPWDVVHNHVVLVWGYEQNGDVLKLHTYDCNRPDLDDITITLDISSPTPAKSITTNGTSNSAGLVRGFFRLPYFHVDPAPAYIDDATVTVPVPPIPLPVSTSISVHVNATNTGSTTWSAGQEYRLGSQAPQDNTNWGTARVELEQGPVDPGETRLFKFDVVSPGVVGTYAFCWQMVREAVHWFGHASPSLPIWVGSISDVCFQLQQQHADLIAQLQSVEGSLAAIDLFVHSTDPRPRLYKTAVLTRQAMALLSQLRVIEAEQDAKGCLPE
jgi:hypothetical protein